jgi:hypothetical protein
MGGVPVPEYDEFAESYQHWTETDDPYRLVELYCFFSCWARSRASTFSTSRPARVAPRATSVSGEVDRVQWLRWPLNRRSAIVAHQRGFGLLDFMTTLAGRSQIGCQDINTDQENPYRQDYKAPTYVVAADQQSEC